MRWSGFFANANIAALVVGLLALLCLCALGAALRRGGGRWWMLSLSSGLLAATGIVLLGLTASRAGALALLVATAALCAYRCLAWRWWPAVAMLLVGAIWMSSYGDRFLPVDASGALVSDGSIDGRVTIWRAGLALCADHPWSGVGLDRFTAIFDDWYLPPERRGAVITVLNDLLMIAAAWGLPALGLSLGMLAGLLWSAHRRALDGSRLAGLLLALAAFQLVMGQFQAHCFAPWPWARLSALLIIVGLLVCAWRSAGVDRRSSLIVGGVALAAAAPVLVVLLAYAAAAPWSTAFHADLLVARPRGVTVTGTVVASVYADGRELLWRRWIDERAAGHLAIAVVDPLVSVDWSSLKAERLLILGTGDAGYRLWDAWRLGELPPGSHLAVIDPDGPPSVASSTPPLNAAILVIHPRRYGHIPSAASLSRALSVDRRSASATLVGTVEPPEIWTQWPVVIDWCRGHDPQR